MCLDKLAFKFEKEYGYYVGWKKFNYINGHNRFQVYGGRVPISKWLDEKDFRPFPNREHIPVDTIYDSEHLYKTGFHVIIGYTDNRELEIDYINFRKVLFPTTKRDGGIVAKGYQHNKEIVIVKKMIVVPKRITDKFKKEIGIIWGD